MYGPLDNPEAPPQCAAMDITSESKSPMHTSPPRPDPSPPRRGVVKGSAPVSRRPGDRARDHRPSVVATTIAATSNAYCYTAHASAAPTCMPARLAGQQQSEQRVELRGSSVTSWALPPATPALVGPGAAAAALLPPPTTTAPPPLLFRYCRTAAAPSRSVDALQHVVHHEAQRALGGALGQALQGGQRHVRLLPRQQPRLLDAARLTHQLQRARQAALLHELAADDVQQLGGLAQREDDGRGQVAAGQVLALRGEGAGAGTREQTSVASGTTEHHLVHVSAWHIG